MHPNPVLVEGLCLLGAENLSPCQATFILVVALGFSSPGRAVRNKSLDRRRLIWKVSTFGGNCGAHCKGGRESCCRLLHCHHCILQRPPISFKIMFTKSFNQIFSCSTWRLVSHFVGQVYRPTIFFCSDRGHHMFASSSYKQTLNKPILNNVCYWRFDFNNVKLMGI